MHDFIHFKQWRMFTVIISCNYYPIDCKKHPNCVAPDKFMYIFFKYAVNVDLVFSVRALGRLKLNWGRAMNGKIRYPPLQSSLQAPKKQAQNSSKRERNDFKSFSILLKALSRWMVGWSGFSPGRPVYLTIKKRFVVIVAEWVSEVFYYWNVGFFLYTSLYIFK